MNIRSAGRWLFIGGVEGSEAENQSIEDEIGECFAKVKGEKWFMQRNTKIAHNFLSRTTGTSWAFPSSYSPHKSPHFGHEQFLVH